MKDMGMKQFLLPHFIMEVFFQLILGFAAARLLGYCMRPFKKFSKKGKLFLCILTIFVINIITEVTEFYEAKYIAVIFYGYFVHQE